MTDCKRRRLFAHAAFCAAAAAAMLAWAPAAHGAGPELLLRPGESPLVTLRLVFRTGAASDPAGKAGAAALTAAMLSAGGSRKMSYDDIVDAFFPMAAEVSAQVDKEMTVFSGTIHVENLDAYYEILRQMLLDPGWREDDFDRLKDKTLNDLRVRLRANNEEELGKEYLYLKIYEDHPYGRQNSGAARSLEAMTLEDVKTFYAANYRRGNLTIGLAGGYPADFPQRARKDFEALADGAPEETALPEPESPDKLRVHIVEKDTRSTLISLGFPLAVNRGHPDWPALKLMQSYFGQHRSSKSRLYQRIREIRGMNYGDYAYIEYFPRGMFLTKPEPNLARRQQIFQIWIRPVVPENGLFALKTALYELDKLVREGIPEKDFAATAEFLGKYVNLLTQTQSDALGYALDAAHYGLPDFNGWIKRQIAGLTRDGVNRAIAKHLRATDLDVVIVTKDAQAMRRMLQAGARAEPLYASPPPDDILAEDKIIGGYKLDIGSIAIVPVETIFEQ